MVTTFGTAVFSFGDIVTAGDAVVSAITFPGSSRRPDAEASASTVGPQAPTKRAEPPITNHKSHCRTFRPLRAPLGDTCMLSTAFSTALTTALIHGIYDHYIERMWSTFWQLFVIAHNRLIHIGNRAMRTDPAKPYRMGLLHGRVNYTDNL